MCSLKVPVKTAAKSFKLSTTSSSAKNRELKLEFLHATDSQVQNVVNYSTCLLIYKSQAHNEKRAARTGRYAKHMKTLMNACKFDEENQITISRFIAQIKRACDSKGVFEGTAL